MKFKDYILSATSSDGYIAVPRFRQVIRKNPRKTAREEAIAAEVIRQANPRQTITGHYPWGPEEQLVLQQLWISKKDEEWRDVPIVDDGLYSAGKDDIPIPEAVREPGAVIGDFVERLREILE